MRLVRGAAGLALACAACRTPTEILVDVSTTADCAAVADGGTSILLGTSTSLAEASPATTVRQCTAGSIGTIYLTPRHGKDDQVAVEVVTSMGGSVDSCEPQSPGSTCIVARRILRYLPHEKLVLPIVMRPECAGVACSLDQTCVSGRCTSAVSNCGPNMACDEGTLEDDGGRTGDGGVGLDASGGARDGGTDTGADAPSDAPAVMSDGGVHTIGLLYADNATEATALENALGAAGSMWFAWDVGPSSTAIPSAATLAAKSDALLVWSRGIAFKDPAVVGDTVASYLEGGKQVVLAGDVYLTPAIGGIGGTMRASYMLFQPAAVTSHAGMWSWVNFDTKPELTAGVASLSMTEPSASSLMLGGNTTPAAELQNGPTFIPAIVFGPVTVLGAPRNRADLGIYPTPKTPTFAGGWTGDGIRLLVNALTYR
jgi:hypothetical protein